MEEKMSSNLTDVTVASGLIKQTISQVEHLEEEKADIVTQIKEVFEHARSQGLDVAVLKQLIKIRKRDPEDVSMEEELLEIYKRALEEPQSPQS
jgi:uncharacterized protein (UPF0335 family)